MKLRLLIPLLLVVLTGCIKNQMTITFELSKDVNSSCRIVYYASAKKGGMMREAYPQITAGKGELKLPQGYPSIMFLFSSSGKNPSAIIYAERGDRIVVSGKGNDISNWKITGNDITDQLTEWRLKNKGVLVGNNEEKLNAAVTKYVTANPNSEAAAVVLYIYYVRRGHEEEFAALETKLSKKITSNKKLMDALATADLLTGAVEATKYPSRIILNGNEGYADTVSLGNGVSTFLMYRGGKSDSDELSVDTLKALMAKRNGKSVVELYAETDSLNWRRHISNDSVAGMKRLWLPLGMADSVAMAMEVKRLPYFIIVDSKGKAVYRGDDFKEASQKFQSLTP